MTNLKKKYNPPQFPIGSIRMFKNGLHIKLDEGIWVPYKPSKHQQKLERESVGKNYDYMYTNIEGKELYGNKGKIITKKVKGSPYLYGFNSPEYVESSWDELSKLKESFEVGKSYLYRGDYSSDQFIKVNFLGALESKMENSNIFYFIEPTKKKIISVPEEDIPYLMRYFNEIKIEIPSPPTSPLVSLTEVEEGILQKLGSGSQIIVSRGTYNARAVYIGRTKDFVKQTYLKGVPEENDVEVLFYGSKDPMTIKITDIIDIGTKNPDLIKRISEVGRVINYKGKEIKIGDIIKPQLKGYESDYELRVTGYYPYLWLVQLIDNVGIKHYDFINKEKIGSYDLETIKNINQLREKELNPTGEKSLSQKILKPIILDLVKQLPISNKSLFRDISFRKDSLSFDVENPILEVEGKKFKQNEEKIINFILAMSDKGFILKDRYTTGEGIAKIKFDLTPKLKELEEEVEKGIINELILS